MNRIACGRAGNLSLEGENSYGGPAKNGGQH